MFPAAYENLYTLGLDIKTIQRMEAGKLSSAQIMKLDLKRGIKVGITFSEKIQENNVEKLTDFLSKYPEFSHLIQPILDDDPKYGSSGEIYLIRIGSQYTYIITLCPQFITHEWHVIKGIAKLEHLNNFLTMVEPFAGFTTNNGDNRLNF